MILFDLAMQEEYRKNDVVLELLSDDDTFTSHRWLLDSLPRRMIYQYMYGDLIHASRRRILDVGGGYCSLSRLLSQRHDYTLLDIMAHDDRRVPLGEAWVNSDWYRFDVVDSYDLVIANDLFPNVDQRLELFVEKFLPSCRQMRLSLTYYNHPRFYHAKRLDADEIFCILAWNGAQLRSVLEKYAVSNLGLLLENPPSLFPNGRQVCMIELQGGICAS